MISLNASENTPTQSPSKLAKVLGALACTACVGAAAVWGLSQTSSSTTSNAQLVNVPDTFSGDFKVEDTLLGGYKAEGFFTKTNDPDGNWVVEGQLNGDATWYLKDSTLYVADKNGTLSCANRKPAYEAWKFALAGGVSAQVGDLTGDVVGRAEEISACKENDPVVFESGDFGKIVLCADGSQTNSASTATLFAKSWTGVISKTEVAKEVVIPENELECAQYDPTMTSNQRQAKKYEEKGQRMLEDSTGWPFSSQERALRGMGNGGGPPRDLCGKQCKIAKSTNGINLTIWSIKPISEVRYTRWCFFIHGAGVDKYPRENKHRGDQHQKRYWGGKMRTLTSGVVDNGIYKGVYPVSHKGAQRSTSSCNRWSFLNMDTRERSWKDTAVISETATHICGSKWCYTMMHDRIFTHSMGGMIVCHAMRWRYFKLRGYSILALSNPPLLGSRSASYVPYICHGGDSLWFTRETLQKIGDVYIDSVVSKRNWCNGKKAKPVYYALEPIGFGQSYSPGYLAYLDKSYCRHYFWSNSADEQCIFSAYRYCGGAPEGWNPNDAESKALGKLSKRACYTSGYCLQRSCRTQKTVKENCTWRGCDEYKTTECETYNNDHDGMVGEDSCDFGKAMKDRYGRRPVITYEETNHADGTGRTGDSYAANLRPNAWFERIATGRTWCANHQTQCWTHFDWWPHTQENGSFASFRKGERALIASAPYVAPYNGRK